MNPTDAFDEDRPLKTHGAVADLEAALERERARRRRAERRLKAAESRFKTLIRHAPVGMALIGSDYRFLDVNRVFCAMLGYPRNDLIRRTFIEITHPEDIADNAHLASHLFDESPASSRKQIRYLTRDRDLLWVAVTALIIRDELERPVARLHICEDFSSLQRAESARQHLQERMTSVESEERRQIARNLHDQMGQDFLLLRKTLEQYAAQEASITGTAPRLADLIGTIEENMRHFSRTLRFAELRHFPIDEALARFVREWENQHGISIDYQSAGWNGVSLPDYIEETLFRVAQEALNNIRKHAYAQQATVLLNRFRDRITLIVEDDGQGFLLDVAYEKALTGHHAGLVGIRERLDRIGGSLTIDTAPGKGARLVAHLPVNTSGQTDRGRTG